MTNYVSGSDFGEVYRLFTDHQINYMIINKPDHNSMGEFNKWLDYHLEKDFHDFKIFRSVDGKFIGFAYSYDFNIADGHCLYTVAIKSEYQEIGIGGFVSLLFLEYLFKTYNLRKIYVHVYSWNDHSEKCISLFGFSLEGTLREYRFYDGK